VPMENRERNPYRISFKQAAYTKEGPRIGLVGRLPWESRRGG